MARNGVGVENLEGNDPAEIKEQCSFKEKWKLDHPWCYAWKDVNGNTRIYCSFCVEHRMTNVFATTGSIVGGRCALVTHAHSREHKEAALLWANNRRL